MLLGLCCATYALSHPSSTQRASGVTPSSTQGTQCEARSQQALAKWGTHNLGHILGTVFKNVRSP